MTQEDHRPTVPAAYYIRLPFLTMATYLHGAQRFKPGLQQGSSEFAPPVFLNCFSLAMG